MSLIDVQSLLSIASCDDEFTVSIGELFAPTTDADAETCEALNDLHPNTLPLYVAAASGASAISANESLKLIIAFVVVGKLNRIHYKPNM